VLERSQETGLDGSSAAGRFLFRLTAIHTVTYLMVGIVASIVIDYRAVFDQPTVGTYMRDFGSVALLVGPLVQVIRGLVTAVVLLPFRAVLAGRLGWLWLWSLLVGLGILSTSAAAPSSIEGIVYSRIPLWYHALGLPEMLLQTLLFSVIAAFYASHPGGVLAELPPVFNRLVRALAVASVAFAAYAVVSVVFALSVGATLDAGQNLTLEVQGIFIIPFVINAGIAYRTAVGRMRKQSLLAASLSYVTGATAVLAYQSIIAHDVSLSYALIAPVLPAVTIWLASARKTQSKSERMSRELA
jgi:hypothetical protein